MSNLLAINSSAASALVWWIIPILGVTGAIIYVIWLAKYKERFDNSTHRSVNSFHRFQSTFRHTKEPQNKDKNPRA